MYVLPDDLRDALKKPFGQVVTEDELLRIIPTIQDIVAVGDMVSYTLLNHGIIPWIYVVDYISKRKDFLPLMKKTLQQCPAQEIQVKNPPGMITDELWDTIKNAYLQERGHPIRIEVDGEEDLAALAAIYLAPSDVTVIYGLPNRGVVIANTTITLKNKVKEILEKM